MYTVYTDEQVFEDGNANIACNLIHETLLEEFSEANVKEWFFLTGEAARIIQGTPPQPVRVISFGTRNDAFFDFCQHQLAKRIGASGSVLYKDQVQIFYSEHIFIEIWLLESPGILVTIKEIIMQNKNNIPSYIHPYV